jgi:hypothetical protein
MDMTFEVSGYDITLRDILDGRQQNKVKDRHGQSIC